MAYNKITADRMILDAVKPLYKDQSVVLDTWETYVTKRESDPNDASATSSSFTALSLYVYNYLSEQDRNIEEVEDVVQMYSDQLLNDMEQFIKQEFENARKIVKKTRNTASRNKEKVQEIMSKEHMKVGSHYLHYQISDIISKDSFIEDNGIKRKEVRRGRNSKEIMAVIEVGGKRQRDGDMSADELTVWDKVTANAVSSMNDLTADIFDIITVLWMETTTQKDDWLHFHSDDALNMRGLKGRTNEDGYQVGYRKQDRDRVMESMAALGAINVVMNPQRIESDDIETVDLYPLFDIGVRRVAYRKGEPIGIYECMIKPGAFMANNLFGAKQVTSYFAKKALHYDPVRKKYEKRLTRYLSWQWKIRLTNSTKNDLERPFSVGGEKGLLKVMGLDESEMFQKNKGKIRKRFEAALDTLVEDKIIENWEYNEPLDEDEFGVGKKGSFEKLWMKAKVIITPTEELLRLYNLDVKDLEGKNNDKGKGSVEELPSPEVISEPSDMMKKEPVDQEEQLTLLIEPDTETITPEVVRQVREVKGVSRAEAAKEIGISRSGLSRFENKVTSKPNKENLRKIVEWVKKNSEVQEV